MGFKEVHTTIEKQKKEPILEKDKIVLSNDAMAIGELLETLINTMRQK
jgi:hypothetical protein